MTLTLRVGEVYKHTDFNETVKVIAINKDECWVERLSEHRIFDTENYTFVTLIDLLTEITEEKEEELTFVKCRVGDKITLKKNQKNYVYNILQKLNIEGTHGLIVAKDEVDINLMYFVPEQQFHEFSLIKRENRK